MFDHVIEGFDSVYPAFASSAFDGDIQIDEESNTGKKCLQSFIMKGICGYSFRKELPEALSSFPNSACTSSIIRHNCDRIVITEVNGKKYIVLIELKSSYIPEDIRKAKDQIVASYVKLVGVLSTIHGFRKEEYKVVGIIVSYAPTQEEIDMISKITDPSYTFLSTLHHDGRYFMPESRCRRFFSPLVMTDFSLFHVPVPGRSSSYSFDVSGFFD